MAIAKFELGSLSTIDGGRISAAFEHALKRCEMDCKDRPATNKARKVTLVAELVPVCSDSGDLESVDVSFQIKDTVPTRESASYNMKAVAGGLVFNELSKDDINQLTLDDAPKPKGMTNAG